MLTFLLEVVLPRLGRLGQLVSRCCPAKGLAMVLAGLRIIYAHPSAHNISLATHRIHRDQPARGEARELFPAQTPVRYAVYPWIATVIQG